MTNGEFSRLVARYQGLVYTVCYQLVQDHQLAEDLTQETFLAAFAHIDRCPPEKYKPWLARVAANKATDHLRSAWHRRVCSQESLPEGPQLCSPAPGPEELTISDSEAQAIREMIDRLEEPYLRVCQMYFLQDRTVQEIAEALRRPPKTVRTQLYRARQLLRAKLNERSDGS